MAVTEDLDIIRLTEPGVRFIFQHVAVLDLVVFVLDLALEKPRRLLKENPGASHSEVMESLGAEDLKKIHRLDQRAWLLDEMLFCREVDNFLVYLEELLGLIYSTKPETLRSSEQVRVDFVLEHSSMEALVRSLARRKVGVASLQGTKKLLETFESLGAQVFGRQDIDHGIRLIETRNAIVHNRGIVDETFLKRVSSFPGKVGDRIHVGGLEEEAEFLLQVMLRVDREAVAHFGLPKCERCPGFPGYVSRLDDKRALK